ncbi:MAG: tetratricopeptide repeat protein [Hormoscilla sp. SP12CHS1]|nr:tetratricopeptide repeat protein [Hormoscilla sp. SP12CHS1]
MRALFALRIAHRAAIDILTAAIAIHPQNAINYNNRGPFYFKSGQHPLALADYTKALQLDPLLSEAYNNRANYYAAHKQLEMALSDYDQAIDLNPFNSRAWINRGITYRHLRLYDLSLDNLDFALRMGRFEAQIYADFSEVCSEDFRPHYKPQCAVALIRVPWPSSENSTPLLTAPKPVSFAG